ncbi:MAG: dTMP kinase [Ignavibacteria bacterium]|nr:dTMP kinase [Ignavibacteria bacterium]MBI3765070.1 dTMP kinase [Ignavibacteriales bacterium]
MFITFEGIDYSGKSTQANLLVECLKQRGCDVLFLREPGGTAISEKIREILLDRHNLAITQKTELFLFSAARTQLVTEVIQPALKSGRVVVCDRFYDSTSAYQGYGRGLVPDDVRTINRIAASGTTPDLTLFINVDVDEVFRRWRSSGLSADRMESSGRRFFEDVRTGYQELAKSEPKRFITIDGMRPVETIHAEIWRIVQTRII